MSGPSRPGYSRLLPCTVPDCSALQIINDVKTTLSKGDLILQLPTVLQTRPAEGAAPAPPQPILLAFVGKVLFPLFKDTEFGTFANDPRQYGFDFQLSSETKTKVRLVLPDNVDEEVQDQFEEVLIECGLLLKGVRAMGDEIKRGATEDARTNAQKIKEGTDEHISSTPAATKETSLEVSKGVQEGAAAVDSGASSVYAFVRRASYTVASIAGDAGARIMGGVSDTTGRSSTQAEDSRSEEVGESGMSDLRKAISEAASGVADGTTLIATTAQDSVSSAIKHNYGDDASTVAASAGSSAKQMGRAAGTAAHSTSVIGVGSHAAQGAYRESSTDSETSDNDNV